MIYQCYIFNPVMTSPSKAGTYDTPQAAIGRIKSDLARYRPGIYGKVVDGRTGETLVKIENVDQITYKADRWDINEI